MRWRELAGRAIGRSVGVRPSPADVDRAEWRRYLDLVRPGMVVFDVGAHIGETTMLFSRFVGEAGSVHSFEANPGSFKTLAAVTEASGRTNFRLNQVAVGEEEGETLFHLYPMSHASWSSRAVRPTTYEHVAAASVEPVSVRMTTLDAYCREQDVRSIDVLKIDIEGGELQALAGARGLLERKAIGCCIFEVGQTTLDMGNRPDQISALLKGHGYDLRNVIAGQPTFPPDDTPDSIAYSMILAVPRWSGTRKLSFRVARRLRRGVGRFRPDGARR